ncbi:MAG: hypothetical protein AB7U92_23055 [Piscinibacter sp.]|uniref:hypothetical protein n=1 Tax=Piscinibacter sp. TaxID=1903157 RepID=UPI003D0D4EA1
MGHAGSERRALRVLQRRKQLFAAGRDMRPDPAGAAGEGASNGNRRLQRGRNGRRA